MNADRRFAAKLCVQLIAECAEIGEMTESAHHTLESTVTHLRTQEYWQLRNQERHAGKNLSTDRQLAVCRVALPALEAAELALAAADYESVMEHLTLAATTEGESVKKVSKRGLRRK